MANFSSEQLTGFILNPDGTLTHHMFTQNFIDSHMFIWRLINEGILDKECFRHSGIQADTKVGNGTALFFAAQYIYGINATKMTGLYNAHPEMRYVPVGPMNYADGSPLTQIETMGRTGSPVIFFPRTNRNLDASFRFIDYVNTIEGLTLAEYGIEGVTWERNADGQPRLVSNLLDRRALGDTTWIDDLRDIGAQYIGDMIFYGSRKMEWFGEDLMRSPEGMESEIAEYSKLRPVKQLPGYPLSALQNTYPDWERIRALLYEGEAGRNYIERAFFASTEAEARNLLLEQQNYMRTVQNGIIMDWLDFMAQQVNSRPDIVF